MLAIRHQYNLFLIIKITGMLKKVFVSLLSLATSLEDKNRAQMKRLRNLPKAMM